MAFSGYAAVVFAQGAVMFIGKNANVTIVDGTLVSVSGETLIEEGASFSGNWEDSRKPKSENHTARKLRKASKSEKIIAPKTSENHSEVALVEDFLSSDKSDWKNILRFRKNRIPFGNQESSFLSVSMVIGMLPVNAHYKNLSGTKVSFLHFLSFFPDCSEIAHAEGFVLPFQIVSGLSGNKAPPVSNNIYKSLNRINFHSAPILVISENFYPVFCFNKPVISNKPLILQRNVHIIKA